MSTFRKIIVPVDGSPPSDEAVKLAIIVARDQRAKLVFFHVIEVARIVAMTSVPAIGVDPSFALSAERQAGEDALARALAAAKAAGIDASTLMEEGGSVDSIIEAAEQGHADLIIIGSHGRGGIARALLGSVAEGVLRRAGVPVLVTRSHERDGDIP
jgi:nucleotide-binding universal stress UspA family protein